MWAVGKIGGPVEARFDTEAEAVAWIVEREKVDPEGVYNGDYFIDSPEEI